MSVCASVLSTDFNREGIQVGTAIATLVKSSGGRASPRAETGVAFRHFWGKAA